MTDTPDHIREAMERLKRVRENALDDSFEAADWLVDVYKDTVEHRYQDDLRLVAYWCIDQQQPIDT